MPVNDALDDGQTHAASFEVFLPMQPLKDGEQFVDIFHVEPDAVVLDRVNDRSPARLSSGIQPISILRFLPILGVLEGIRKQIDPDELQEPVISQARGQVRQG